MNFVRRQINDIRKGGLGAVWRKVFFFPELLLGSSWGKSLVLRSYPRFVRLPWAGAIFRLGRRLGRYGRSEEAVACFQRTVSLKPDWAEAHFELARMLIKVGRFEEAFAAWEELFRLRPDWPEAHSRIQNEFYFAGQTWAARKVMQAGLDVCNSFAREHQLDQLGIRFPSEFATAIGHIAVLDSYVKMDMLARRSSARPVVLVRSRVSNPCYLDYWQRYLPGMITDATAVALFSPVEKYLQDRIFCVMDSTGKQEVGRDYVGAELQADIQTRWEAEGRAPLLTLSESDHERGWRCLQELGLPSDAWFVSLHVREGKTASRGVRDASISTYGPAIDAITGRGGWVIRMGDQSMTPLPPMPQAVDYAHSRVRCDWMDVFLWASCRFFVGTQSGPAWVPPTFGVPCVATNWNFLSRRWFGQDLFITKLLWSDARKRYLTFAEALTSSAGVAESLDYLATKQISVVDNTAEEIRDTVVEMIDRLEGKAIYTPEDERLREKFDAMWVKISYWGAARMGRDFLRKWADLV